MLFVLVQGHMHVGACVSCFVVAEYACVPRRIGFVRIGYLLDWRTIGELATVNFICGQTVDAPQEHDQACFSHDG